MLLLVFPLHPPHQLEKIDLNHFIFYFYVGLIFFFFKPWHILLLHMICVLTAWENNNEINLKKFTKLNFFVDWWVRFGWIFCLFFFFSLYIYYFYIWHVFWRHEKRKMKLTWQNLLTQYFCGLIMANWVEFFFLALTYTTLCFDCMIEEKWNIG